MQKLSRYYHTIKPLKFEQIFYRLKYRFAPVKSLSSAPSAELTVKPSVKNWNLNPPRFGEQSLFESGEVCFLNKRAQIVCREDWNDESKHSKLWLYNLHYFDDLNAIDAESRHAIQKQFILKWVEENPPLQGNGWEPYPLSLRLVNWVKWCQANHDFEPVMLSSIEQQTDALMAQLEFHILGNHLFANAKALVFVGCFLEGDRADAYLTKGLDLLKREVTEQFLADGGHFELSPMYHCILLWDMLDLYNLAKASKDQRLSEFLPRWHTVIEKGLEWLAVMSHPDGDISFFNDAAFGIAPSPMQVLQFASAVNIAHPEQNLDGIVTLHESGYSRLQKGQFTLLFDHAEVGPDYLPGHAHADTLSIELSYGRHRVFVNSGTSEYGTGSERQRQRSTTAHNTLFVNAKNSSDVWAGFRVGQRAHVSQCEAKKSEASVSVCAQHDGFCHLVKGLTHTRKATVTADKVIIEDMLGQTCTNPVLAHFHLHPEVAAELIDANTVRLTLTSGETLIFRADEPVKLQKATWHPEFGKSVPSTRIAVVLSGSSLTSELTLGS